MGNVVLENQRGMELLVDHIAAHGHTRIGFLGGPNNRTSGVERLNGFKAAMARNGVDLAPELVGECDWTIASGFDHARALLALPQPPTALITASGELAMGALVAARRARVAIPEDVALACFDDLYFAPLLEPSLTSIAYDARAIGRDGADLLLAAIEDQDAPWSEARIDVELVCRRSCGCDHDPGEALAEVLR